MISEPYLLTAGNGWIGASGPVDAIKELSRSVSLFEHDSWHWFEASYKNHLIAETVWPISEATDAYRTSRENFIGLPSDKLQEWRTWISQMGIDDSLFSNYQVNAISQGYSAGRLYNASDPGTGKTRVALALLHLWGVERSLVVVQRSIMDEWVNEARKIGWPGRVEVLSGTIAERAEYLSSKSNEKGLILVTNYEAFSPRVTGMGRKKRVIAQALTNAALVFAPQGLVVDESWKLSTPTTKWTVELDIVATCAEHVILNSGTPVGKSTLDLYPQLKILGWCPWSEKEYTETFVNFEKHRIGKWVKERPRGGKNMSILLDRIWPVWFRVVKEGVTDLIPKREPQVVTLEMTSDLKRFTSALLKGEVSVDRDDLLDNPLTTKLRVTQLCGGVLFNNIENRLMEFNCAKLDWILQFARDNWENNPGRRAIIWHRFNDEMGRVCTKLREVLGERRVVVVSGDEGNYKLAPRPMLDMTLTDVKQSFNSKHPDGVQVIICQTEKMAYGHNLQACDDSICFTHTWRYIARQQLMDRSHRLGREGQVNYYDLCYRDSKDEEILATLRNHRDFAINLEVESYRELKVDV